MKTLKHFLMVGGISICLSANAQWTQLGADIDGEAAGDYSGWSVSLSSDGSVLAVGARNNAGNGIQSGQVRVYQNQGGNWTQLGADIDGETAYNYSGVAVSLSSDGSIVAIGAITNSGSGSYSGHVRVYGYQGGSWVQLGTDIDGEAENDYSGNAVSLSSDGTIIAIGAKDNEYSINQGQVRVYKYQGGNWVQLGADIDGKTAGDHLGHSVSLSSDGSVLASGAPANENNGENSGNVQVFENQGGNWVQLGTDINGEAASDQSGWSVSLSSDGSIVAIGAPTNSGNGSGSGQVRVFENQGGTWVQLGADIDGQAANEIAGWSLSLSSSGTIVGIGVNGSAGNGSLTGAVRVYEYQGGSWVQLGTDIDGEAAGDQSGFSVSLSSNGLIVASGAVNNDGIGSDSGHVRVFNNPSLSITSNNFGPQFKAYPNPSFGSINIELGSLYQEVKISVYDLFGKEMMLKTYNNTDKILINNKQFATGVYVVKVETIINKASLKLIIK